MPAPDQVGIRLCESLDVNQRDKIRSGRDE
jgi:hypothetical protein